MLIIYRYNILTFYLVLSPQCSKVRALFAEHLNLFGTRKNTKDKVNSLKLYESVGANYSVLIKEKLKWLLLAKNQIFNFEFDLTSAKFKWDGSHDESIKRVRIFQYLNSNNKEDWISMDKLASELINAKMLDDRSVGSLYFHVIMGTFVKNHYDYFNDYAKKLKSEEILNQQEINYLESLRAAVSGDTQHYLEGLIHLDIAMAEAEIARKKAVIKGK